MCGRYLFTQTDYDELMDELELEPSPAVRERAIGEIFPGTDAPVIASAKSGRIASFAMHWGFRLPNGKWMINGRSETAGQRPLFRESAEARRCIVPARLYYEWGARADGKQKYAFSASGGDPLYLGGLYRLTAPDEPQFVILTREAVGRAREIHSRMPLLLPCSAVRDWLGHDLPYEQAAALCALPPLDCAAV